MESELHACLELSTYKRHYETSTLDLLLANSITFPQYKMLRFSYFDSVSNDGADHVYYCC